jgi:hypothetical protein
VAHATARQGFKNTVVRNRFIDHGDWLAS